MALTDKLSAIGTAIRAKTGKQDLLTLDEMPVEIEAIQTGGAVETIEITANGTYTAPEGIDGYNPITVNVPQDGAPSAEELTVTGNCNYKFAYDGWNWFINKYRNQITTNEISKASSMFAQCTSLTSADIGTINLWANHNQGIDIDYMFASCNELTSLPKLTGVVSNKTSLFYGCNKLRTIPESFYEGIDWTLMDTTTLSYLGSSSGMFNKCYSLRQVPMELLAHTNQYLGTYACMYSDLFSDCCALDEIVDLPVRCKTEWTSNVFGNTFYCCHRAKNITFALNPETNAPYVVSWKSQTIDLSYANGHTVNSTHTNRISSYNSGITEDKLVTDDASYQALKDDPDWYTSNIAYSRYNHDSAVATINSLPDTSAYLATEGGTNTIKFKGAAGELTDGGAINTLTEEEIAVATAKGWTVTLV